MTLYDDLDLPDFGNEDGEIPGFRETLLWKDLKWGLSLLLFLSVLGLGLRW